MLLVNASFIVYNEQRLEAQDLVDSVTTLRSAFEDLVESVVAQVEGRGRQLRYDTRHLLATLRPDSSTIRAVAPLDCPSLDTIPNGATCHMVFGNFELFVEDEDPDVVRARYENAIQGAIEDGKLQDILDSDTPAYRFKISNIASNPLQNKPKSSKEEMAWWVILFIVLGCVSGLAGICCIGGYFYTGRSTTVSKPDEDEEEAPLAELSVRLIEVETVDGSSADNGKSRSLEYEENEEYEESEALLEAVQEKAAIIEEDSWESDEVWEDADDGVDESWDDEDGDDFNTDDNHDLDDGEQWEEGDKADEGDSEVESAPAVIPAGEKSDEDMAEANDIQGVDPDIEKSTENEDEIFEDSALEAGVAGVEESDMAQDVPENGTLDEDPDETWDDEPTEDSPSQQEDDNDLRETQADAAMSEADNVGETWDDEPAEDSQPKDTEHSPAESDSTKEPTMEEAANEDSQTESDMVTPAVEHPQISPTGTEESSDQEFFDADTSPTNSNDILKEDEEGIVKLEEGIEELQNELVDFERRISILTNADPAVFEQLLDASTANHSMNDESDVEFSAAEAMQAMGLPAIDTTPTVPPPSTPDGERAPWVSIHDALGGSSGDIIPEEPAAASDIDDMDREIV